MMLEEQDLMTKVRVKPGDANGAGHSSSGGDSDFRNNELDARWQDRPCQRQCRQLLCHHSMRNS